MKTSISYLIAATTTLMLISAQAQSKTSKDLMKQYKSAAKKQELYWIKNQNSKASKLMSYTKTARSEFRQLFDKSGPAQLKDIESRFGKVLRSSLPSGKKQQLFSKTVKRNSTQVKRAYKGLHFDESAYAKYVSKVFKAKVKKGEVGSVSITGAEKHGEPALRDLSFIAPYQDEYRENNNSGIGNTSTDVEVDTGLVDTNATTFLAGVHSSKSGVSEIIDVPAGLNQVKITATIDVGRYNLFAGSDLNVSYASSHTFMNVFSDNRMKCEQDNLLASSVSFLIWISTNSGEKLTTVTCTLNVNGSSQRMVVSAGVRSFSLSTPIFGIGSSTTNAIVNSIDVEFID